MRYRRILPIRRRYFTPYFGVRRPSAPNHSAEPVNNSTKITNTPIPKIESIPLPNESPLENTNKNTTRQRHPLLSFLPKQFGTDEIILLGLILLMLEEKVEDEFLLIVLIYLFISGLE